MSWPVIPPLISSLTQIQSQQASEILHRRIVAVEKDTHQILSQLGNLGQLKQIQLNPHSEYGQSTTHKERAVRAEKIFIDDNSVHPSEESMVESMPNNFSRDTIITRVCKLESMLQTLKVGLAGILSGVNGNVDKKRLKAEVEERVNQIKQELETEVLRLKRQVTALQEELNMESQAEQRWKEECEKLKEVLEESAQARAEAAGAVEEMSITKQKLMTLITDLKEEISREASLRASLEVSHSTLMSRIHETEIMAERERNEAQAALAKTANLHQEASQLKEELASEISRRQIAEETCQLLSVEKENIQAVFQSAQSECLLASSELTRLQSQYSDLIHQFEEAQNIVDKQKLHTQEVEEERDRLSRVADQALTQQQRVKALENELSKTKESHRLEREVLEEEISKQHTIVTSLTMQNSAVHGKLKTLQVELNTSQKTLASQEQDFSSAAEGLERELSNMRRRLQSLEIEKETVLKGKESLLEEVNQTVDSLISERGRLQGDVEKLQAETEGLRIKLRQTEAENLQLTDRISSFEQQHRTQRKVETTLQEMLEQKSRLAYDNGRLQSQVTQLTQDLTVAHTQSADSAQLRKVNEMTQNMLIQVQQEAEEFKMAAQKLEGQLQHVTDLLEQKQHELQLTQARREELEKEMGKVLGRVEVLESREKSKQPPAQDSRDLKSKQHQKNMEDAKAVNREIANTLEAVMQSHTQLQDLVENLQAELGRRDTEIARLKNLGIKDKDSTRLEKQRLEEIMDTLRTELKKEQDKSGRKITRDVAELKKQNHNLSTRNGELVATNTELRQRIGDMEQTLGELQNKLSTQKHKLDHMHKAKKHVEENLQCMKQIREDVDELEKVRDEYIQKNREQAETISTFMQQMAVLQEEVKQLATAQMNTGHLLQLKEEALEKERKIREELKKKYSESRKREDEVSKQKHVCDEKLKEAHNESVEISRNLLEAHEWFKGKFAKLQEELLESKAAQSKLAWANSAQRQQLLTEKSHAHRTAERAKEMIKVSHQTISKLASYTDQANSDTKQQQAELRAEGQQEKAHATYIGDKYHYHKDPVSKAFSSNIKKNSYR